MIFKNHSIRLLLIGGLSLGAWIAPSHAWSSDQAADSFQESTVGEFPKDWDTYPLQMGKAKKVYKIEQEGSQKFLRAEDDSDLSVTIFRAFNWNIQKYPYLKFRWRAQTLPQVSKGGKIPVNDHACGVYVGFGWTTALKYVWTTAMSKGSYWEKEPGKFYVISLESSPEKVGKWQSQAVNIPEDYQKYFGKAPSKNPTGIAILTDGNNSHQKAACDYADFRISEAP